MLSKNVKIQSWAFNNSHYSNFCFWPKRRSDRTFGSRCARAVRVNATSGAMARLTRKRHPSVYSSFTDVRHHPIAVIVTEHYTRLFLFFPSESLPISPRPQPCVNTSHVCWSGAVLTPDLFPLTSLNNSRPSPCGDTAPLSFVLLQTLSVSLSLPLSHPKTRSFRERRTPSVGIFQTSSPRISQQTIFDFSVFNRVFDRQDLRGMNQKSRNAYTGTEKQ